MTIQETTIAKLRNLPDPLTHLVNDFIDFLLGQWAKLPNQPPSPQPELTTDLEIPNLKRVGSFWVVKATGQSKTNWDQLIQDDRDSRLATLAGQNLPQS